MMRMTSGNAVWNEFCNKMRRDELSRDDFTDENANAFVFAALWNGGCPKTQ